MQLILQFAGRIETDYFTQSLQKFYFQRLPIQRLRKIQQVAFDFQFVFLEGRIGSDVNRSVPGRLFDKGPASIDSWRRAKRTDLIQIRSWESNGRTAAFPGDDGPPDAVGLRHQLLGTVDVASLDQLSQPTA